MGLNHLFGLEPRIIIFFFFKKAKKRTFKVFFFWCILFVGGYHIVLCLSINFDLIFS